ncbi:MAG: cytochrome B, partial [Boseongicola sp.]|nr:cytochrome B [Boseongicola sp.]
LHSANAPIWMWGAIMIWWAILLGVAFILQVTLGAVDTYQAIWGIDPELPGNRIEPIGFGIKRLPPGGKT